MPDPASVVVMVIALFVATWILAFCFGSTSKDADERAQEMMEKRARDQGRG
jgi:hypothetical protein